MGEGRQCCKDIPKNKAAQISIEVRIIKLRSFVSFLQTDCIFPPFEFDFEFDHK